MATNIYRVILILIRKNVITSVNDGMVCPNYHILLHSFAIFHFTVITLAADSGNFCQICQQMPCSLFIGNVASNFCTQYEIIY